KLPANIYQRWHFAGQFWIGVSAWPALWQYFELPVPMIDDPNHPDGRVPDPFWYNWQRCPSEAAINQLWVAGDKMLDLGWVYTVIAGVLNLLVIYDAYAGPAFREEPPGAPPKPTGDRSSQEATA
ncbi:MAG: hypothetical protein NZO58_10180, partial [Gemmataceae bacterium]|nr:hypothetical protein [Gemmataceae bacterium]